MSIKISTSWTNVLSSEFEKPYFKDLITFVEEEYLDSICYPPKSEIFSAFDFCSFDDVKVVVIGQDPYHGFGQANALVLLKCLFPNQKPRLALNGDGCPVSNT